MKRLLLCAAALACMSHAAAQSFPSRPVRMIVPFPPGGSSDAVGRILAERLSGDWKQPMVVENRPGAGTTIASAFVAGSPPDGHVLYLQGVSTYASTGALYRNLSFDPVKGFTPVANVTLSPFVLAVHPSVKATTALQLVELARARPGVLSYGSSGSGGTPHLFAEVLANGTGTRFLHVPYKGLGPAMTALISGEINFLIADVTVMPHVKAGKVRALAVTTPKQTPVVPGVPTLGESGIPGMSLPSYIAVLGPAGMPRDLVGTLNADINRALANPDVRNKLFALGFEPAGGTPEELAAHMSAEVQRLTAIIRDAGVKLD
jgi:tripartite-type tricarboxylate transporter receptor subunit TctC